MEKIKIMLGGHSWNSSQGLSFLSFSLAKRFYKTDLFDIIYCTVSGEDTTIDSYKIWGEEYKEFFENVTFINHQLLESKKALDFDRIVSEVSPKIILTVCDPWMLDYFVYSAYRNTYFLVNYVTIETPTYPDFVMLPTSIVPNTRKSIKNMMNISDLVIPVTNMGKNTLLKLGLINVAKEHVYNGLDLETLCKYVVTKKQAFGNLVNDDDFIFMTMGVNNERKKLDRTIEAFYKFLLKKGKQANKYKLYLHAPVDIQQGGTDLKEMINKLKLNNNVLIVSNYKKEYGIDKKLLYEKYAACDCVISLTGGEGFGYNYCSPAGTSILTDKGIISIENIKKDDKVISHTGNTRNVLGTTSRYFDGYMHNIKTLSNIPLSVTKGHRLFGIKIKKEFTLLKENDLKPDWYPVESFSKGDLLAIPKIKSKNDNLAFLKISDYVENLVEDNNYVYFYHSKKTKNENSLNTIAKKCGCTFQTVHKIITGKLKAQTELGNKVREYCKEIDYKIPNSIKCLNNIELTPDVMEFFGLYIAEGTLCKYSFGICLHQNEIYLQELTYRVCKKIFGNVEIKTKFTKNTKSCEVVISSSMASKFLGSLFGEGALNKQIPSILYNNKNIGYLLKGYFEGDGCFKNGITACTISKRLSYDIFYILNLNKIPLAIHYRKHIDSFSKKVKNKDNKIISKNIIYHIHVYEQYKNLFFNFVGLNSSRYIENKTKRKQTFIKENENYFFVPIISNEKEKVKMSVYNMHVENDKSYLAEGISSHNCEGIAHNKPVIYTDYGGHAEYCKNFGLPVSVKDYTNAANGFIQFALADTDIAAEKMVQISSDKKLYNKCIQGMSEFVKQNFDWNKNFEKLYDILMSKYNEYLNKSNSIRLPLKRII